MKPLFGGPVRGHVQVEILSAYLDEQASAVERAYVDAHLQECRACQAELDSLRRTVVLLQALPRVAVPRAFTLSEAQVGIRRPEPAPGWIGGLVRGLGVVAAVVLVAFVAVSVLRPEQAPWNPSQTVARVAAPTAVPAAVPADQATNATTMGAAAPEVAPAPAAQEAVVAKSAPPESTVASAPEPATLAAAPPPEPEQPAAMAAEAAPTEAVADAAAVPEPQATATMEEPALVAKAAATPEPEMGAAAMGRGGGGGGPGEGGIPPEYLTPEATPPGQPLSVAVPSGVRFAYADLNALWGVDRDGGARQLAQGREINTPQLSPDQKWVAYRIFTDKGLQLWAVRWEGGEPKLLLDDANLPADRLPVGYSRRAFSDSRWGPGNKILSITLSLVPDPAKPLAPILELWRLNVETGELKYSNELGRAWRPFYSPSGLQFLTVAYGSEEAPEGAVTLYDTEGGTATTVLSFPASPGKLGYDGQVAWAPDGSSAWIAIPTPDYGQPVPPNGTKLHRLSDGAASELSEIDAYQVFWAPAADKMAYTRYISETMSANELHLAGADGSNPELYATMTNGQFVSWSPSGNRFLYEDNYQIFVGERGKAPVRLSNAVSTVGPRWISDDKIVALQDTGDGWLLVLRDVGGDASGLLPLPRDAMWDVGTRL